MQLVAIMAAVAGHQMDLTMKLEAVAAVPPMWPLQHPL